MRIADAAVFGAAGRCAERLVPDDRGIGDVAPDGLLPAIEYGATRFGCAGDPGRNGDSAVQHIPPGQRQAVVRQVQADRLAERRGAFSRPGRYQGAQHADVVKTGCGEHLGFGDAAHRDPHDIGVGGLAAGDGGRLVHPGHGAGWA